MDHKHAIEQLIRLEDQVDVTALDYKDLSAWPYIRMQFWNQLLHPGKYTMPAALPLPQLAQQMKGQFFKTDAYVPYLQHNRLHQQHLANLTAKGPVDVLLFSRVEDHADRFNGASFNRHIDPLADLLHARFRYLKLELGSSRARNTRPRYEDTYFLDSIDYLKCDAQRSLIRAFQDPELPCIAGNEGLEKALNTLRLPLSYGCDWVVLELEKQRHYRKYFIEILEALQPRAVMLVCYYYDLAMALVAACRSLGIPTIDVQHGKQGKYHGMYTHWRYVPEAGFNTVPDYFWCWGQESVDNIERWLPSNRETHRPIVGGHTWLSQWVEPEGAPPELDASMQAYAADLNRQEKVILVSMQPVDDPLPISLRTCMKVSPADWRWLIRLHPLQKNQIGQIKARLEAEGIEADVALATEMPLYLLLNHCDHHVTQWSSVAYEALRFTVPTTFIHPTARVLFQDYLDQGLFGYADTSESLLSRLIHTPLLPDEPAPYIETSRLNALQTLSSIVHERVIVGS